MRALLAIALLLGISSLTVARAEWEALCPGTAVLSRVEPAGVTGVEPVMLARIEPAAPANPFPGGVGAQPY